MSRVLPLVLFLLAAIQDPAPRVDLAGDPLPEGAVARLGTRRWRTPGRVWSLAFGKDARTVLVGAGTTLLLWDVEKNERIRSFQGHRGVVGSIAVHPDGTRVLTGSGDGTMGLWNLETGKRLRSFTGHAERVWTVAFSRDGATALSAGMDGTLGVWNVESGRRLHTLAAHKGPAMAAAFIDNDARILSGGADGRLVLWDAATGAKLKVVDAHKGQISSLAISPDGRTAVTTCGLMIPGETPEPAEGAWSAWDIPTGRRLRHVTGRAGFLWAAFTPDGRGVLASSSDRTAGLWDLDSGALLLPLEGLGDRFHPLAIRDGLIAVGDGTAVALFDAATGRRRFGVPGHSDGVGGVGFLPDGRAVTAGADGWISIWDPATGRRLSQIDTGALEFGSLALSADGTMAVAGGWRAPTTVWNLETGALLHRIEAKSARGLAFGPGFIAAGLLDGRVVLWNLELDVRTREVRGTASGTVALRPDGKLALVPAPPKAASVIDLETGQARGRLEGHERDVTCLAFSADGAAAATGGGDGRVLLWDGACGKETGRIEAGSPVRALAFGPKGRIVLGHSNGVSVWDVASGRRLAVFQGQGGVTSVAMDREGRRIISGSGDTTAMVWELKD